MQNNASAMVVKSAKVCINWSVNIISNFGRHYFTEYVLKRLPFAAIFSSLVLLLFLSDSGLFSSLFMDRDKWFATQTNASANAIFHKRVMDVINDGYYLGRPHKSSQIRDRSEDYGGYLFLANKSLLQRALGLKSRPLDYRDYRSIQMYIWIMAIFLLLLPSIPLSASLLGVLTSFIFYFYGPLEWQPLFRWPTTFSVIFTLALLISLFKKPNFSTTFIITDFIILGLFTGYLGLLRADGKYIFYIPFLIVIIINILYLLVTWILHTKKSNWLNSFLSTVKQNGSLTSICGMALVILLSGTLLVKTIVMLDVLYFEHKDQVSHRPLSAGHVLWHNTYLSLGINGQNNFNYQGIYWLDNCAFSHVQIELGGPIRNTKTWEKAARKITTDIIYNDPMLFVSAITLKASLLIKRYLFLVILFCAAICFSMIKSLNHIQIGYHAGILSMAGICTVPCLISQPASLVYTYGFQAAMLASVFFLLIPLDHDKTEHDKKAWKILSRIFFTTVAIVAMGAAFFIYENYQERNREANRLLAGAISYESFLNVYPANAASSFNSISKNQRSKLGQKIRKNRAATNLGKIDFLPHSKKAPPYELLNATWKGNTLFLLLNFPKSIGVARNWKSPPSTVIPLVYNYRDKFTNLQKAVPFYEIILPNHVDPGVWLFYAKGMPKKLESVTLGQPRRWNPRAKLYANDPLYRLVLP